MKKTYGISPANPTMVLRSDGACIAIGENNRDEKNPDWQEYNKWLEEGGKPELLEPPKKPAETIYQNELQLSGVTDHAVIWALWEMMYNGNKQPADVLAAKIAAAKEKAK